MSSLITKLSLKGSSPLFGKKKFDEKISKYYKFLEIIGRGAFSEVIHCKKISTDEDFAVKCVVKKDLHGKLSTLESEIKILKRLKHPNIVTLIEIIDNKDKLYLVMDLVNGGELFDRIIEKGTYTELDASSLVKQLVGAVSYLHELNIIHRDLKPENLLYYSRDPNSKIMITDFGLARLVDDAKKDKIACGTPGYVAPEVLKYKLYGTPVDCWAIGVITYILLCGYPPFYDDDDQRLYLQIMEADYEFEEPYWDEISDSAKDFVTCLMELNHETRYSCGQALNHEWICGGASGNKDIHGSVTQQIKKHFDAKSKWKQAFNAAAAINRMKNLNITATKS